MTTENNEKINELRDSAQLLAKQALETAELGIRLVRTQFESASQNQPPQVAEIQRTIQDNALNAETKAKELFSIATSFMSELNNKWQPAAAGSATGEKPAAEKPKAEKIDISFD
jgi:hypothetical protein